MAGPWEKYQQTTPVNDGPWSKYGDQQPPAVSTGGAQQPAAGATPTGTISAAPTGVKAWLDQVEGDVRYGSGNTVPGKILKMMGARGINRGVSEATADQIASPIVGTINAAKGIANTPDHPVAGPLQAVGGALQAASLPMAFMGGPAAETAINAIPSRAYAGRMLGEVADAAGTVPINTHGVMTVAKRTEELAGRGGTMPKVVRDFLERVSPQPNVFPKAPDTASPMTFAEGRDFYSNASRLSADETNRLTPVVKRQAGKFTQELGGSLQEAATAAGQGEKYASAMTEYARASKMRDATEYMIKKGLPAGVATLIAERIVSKAWH